jgi:phosphoribosyl 1,2-cyclic phosphodiesterase
VEFRPDNERLVIIDCGTGLRQLGNHLMSPAVSKPIKADIFLSHTHWDHLHGFPFFTPAFIPGNSFNIRGPVDFDSSLENIFKGQMKYQYFPVKLSEMAAKLTFQELKEGEYDFEGLRVTAKYLNHPILVLGYRFTVEDKVFVYASDTEPYYNIYRPRNSAAAADAETAAEDPSLAEADQIAAEENSKIKDFIKDADLLVYDAQYTAEEYKSKISWGHTSMEVCVDQALEAGVKKLALFHHDPMRSDKELETLVIQMRQRVKKSSLKVFAAWEGQEILV